MKKKIKKFDYTLLNIEELEKEIKSETYKSKYYKILRSTIYALIIVAAVVALIATLFMPVIQISGSSMAPNLEEGQIVVTLKNVEIKNKNIIAYYHGNKILVKRVIGGPGSYVTIDEEGNIYVDNLQLYEPYIKNKQLGDTDIEFPYQVPDGHYFVLSDDRENLIDSRNSEIGWVAKEDIIGKLMFRVWPIKDIKTIN